VQYIRRDIFGIADAHAVVLLLRIPAGGYVGGKLPFIEIPEQIKLKSSTGNAAAATSV
jgi:hypothetical protein